MAIVGIVQAIAVGLICLVPILMPAQLPGHPDALLTVLIYDAPPPPPPPLPKGSALRPEPLQWLFEPALKDGRRVATVANAPVHFRIF